MTASGGLSSGTDFLRDAAVIHFNGAYQHPAIKLHSEVDSKLNWKPSIQLKLNEHLTLLAEASEEPYPLIFRLRRADITQLNLPITIACICPEEVYLKEQGAVKELREHGYGLLTVAADGSVQSRFSSIPIVQQISESEIKDEVAMLPAKIKRAVIEAYDLYNVNAPAGVANITEILEGVVLKAGQDAVRKKLINKSDARPGFTAQTLNAMVSSGKFNNKAAALGGCQSYVSRWRNTAHHFPKDKKQAMKKYRECRFAFVSGMKEIKEFRTAMKDCGLSGGM